jgi:hypothetical protein
MRRLQTIAGAATVALAASLAAVVPPAEAARPQRTLASGLLSPLSLAVSEGGTAYFTQNFGGMLMKKAPGRKARVVYQSKNGHEVGGVSVRNGRVIFTETASDAQGAPSDSWLKVLRRHGKARTLAHIRAYENRRNPDKRTVYGVRGISASCASQWPTDQFGPATYRGLPDSHPYATWQTARTTYVADAGMNAIIAVGRKGRIRTVSVLPPVPVRITAQMAQQMGVPGCAVGLTYYGEPVPTDVERAADGRLLVTTEGGGLGEQMPLGALYRIRGNGKAVRITGGLFAPVGLAVNSRGDVFVSQLFGMKISKVRDGRKRARTWANVNMPAALDYANGHLYATTDVLVGADPSGPPSAPGGKLVRFR